MAKINDFVEAWELYKTDDYAALRELGPKFEPLEDITTGFMSPPSEAFLNLLVSNFLDDDEQYLEIGTFGGRSLIAALQGNQAKAQVIDPLPNCFRPGYVRTIKEWFDDAINATGIAHRITLHRMKYEVFQGDMPQIGIFLYDGSHERGHTLPALLQYQKYLADQAIIIVDDWHLEDWISKETMEFVDNTPEAEFLDVLPIGQYQGIVLYRRN